MASIFSTTVALWILRSGFSEGQSSQPHVQNAKWLRWVIPLQILMLSLGSADRRQGLGVDGEVIENMLCRWWEKKESESVFACQCKNPDINTIEILKNNLIFFKKNWNLILKRNVPKFSNLIMLADILVFCYGLWELLSWRLATSPENKNLWDGYYWAWFFVANAGV